MIRRLLRGLLRLALRAAVMAAVVAAIRAVLGRAAGEPGVPGDGGRTVPMSLDRWPPVPQAPARNEGPAPAEPPSPEGGAGG